MIQIVSAVTVTTISPEDFKGLIEMAEEGMRLASQYDLSNDLAPMPDPQAEAERALLISRCKVHLGDSPCL